MNDQTTHADGCWSWGPKHYECAAREFGRRFILVDNNPEALAVMARRFDGVEGIEWVGFDPRVVEMSND